MADRIRSQNSTLTGLFDQINFAEPQSIFGPPEEVALFSDLEPALDDQTKKTAKIKKSAPPHEHDGTGHRERLRDRLLTGGDEALADYEVLEYLLFGASARGDTKPLAKSLLACFGSLAGVLNAETSTLEKLPGLGKVSVGTLKVAALAARRMARAGNLRSAHFGQLARPY